MPVPGATSPSNGPSPLVNANAPVNGGSSSPATGTLVNANAPVGSGTMSGPSVLG